MKNRPRILSISVDQELLETRELLLQSVGYEVCSTASVEESVKLAGNQKFDLILLGHSLGIKREALVADLRERSSAPVLALHKREGEPLKAVQNLFTLHPVSLLNAVKAIVDGQASQATASSFR